MDQVGSRGAADLVAPAVGALAGIPLLRRSSAPPATSSRASSTTRTRSPASSSSSSAGDAWSVGIGFGAVGVPLPASARAGRGAAYQRARAAVDAAKGAPWRVCVRGPDPEPAAAWRRRCGCGRPLLARRTTARLGGRDLLDGGASHAAAARSLGVTPRLRCSQRARAAGIVEGRRARELRVVPDRSAAGRETGMTAQDVRPSRDGAARGVRCVPAAPGWSRAGRVIWPPFSLAILLAALAVAGGAPEIEIASPGPRRRSRSPSRGASRWSAAARSPRCCFRLVDRERFDQPDSRRGRRRRAPRRALDRPARARRRVRLPGRGASPRGSRSRWRSRASAATPSFARPEPPIASSSARSPACSGPARAPG